MSLSTRTAGVMIFALLAAVAGAGAFLGSAVASDLTERGEREVVLEDPQGFAQRPPGAKRSAGGFTGFGGLPALSGVVLHSGTISESSDGSLLVDAPNVRTTVDFTEPLRLFRIRPAESPLAPGDVVLVRTADGTTTGVLRLLIQD